MKNNLLIALLLFTTIRLFSQSNTGSFTVNGDLDKFYPVVWLDAAWIDNKALELEIGRSWVHTNSDWRGSLISKFRVHCSFWGNNSHFIDADIHYSKVPFIADWQDVSTSNSSGNFIIWLRGGGTTYYFNCNKPIDVPGIYDGVQLPLTYQQINGPIHTFKTETNPSVNQYGSTFSSSVIAKQNGIFLNKVGIGTTNPQNTLDVNGTIHAREVKVDLIGWSDFVFRPDYKLRTLPEIEQFIKTYGHLPEIPSAKEVEEKGVNVGEMQAKLLQKVEELTLYLIELQKENAALRKDIELLKK